MIYFLKRVFAMIPVAIGVVVLVGLLINFVPGDPVDVMLGAYATDADKIALKEQLGLNQPVLARVFDYVKNVLHGDLGKSLIFSKPVSELVSERIPATFSLALTAMLVATLLSIPVGIFAAARRDSIWDRLSMTVSVLGVCIPNFWMGPMLVLIFALHFNLFPVSEKNGLISYVLPSFTMGFAMAAILSRMTRNTMIDVLKEDYVRTAKAKGNRSSKVILKHAFRNASIPLVTVIGLQFGVLLTGAIITERVFDWPGLGSLIVEGINNRDYPLVQGCVIVFSVIYLTVNLCTDLLYAIIDPRIRVDA